MLLRTLVGAVALTSSHLAVAIDLAGEWAPYSRTAMAITGPVSFEGNVMTLSGKPAFRYKQTMGSDYYRLTPTDGSNPVFLNGNKLCGPDEAPSWMRVSMARDDVLSITILNQRATDDQSERSDVGVCGTYNYVR